MLGFNPDQQKKTQVRKKKGAGKDQQNSAPNLNAENPAIAGGGLIQGPGTGTSDDIQTQMPAGSYIMPADSTEQIGEEGLAGLGSPADVHVSNGEYQLPPEQVHAVGVQALDQMKDATHTPVAKGFNPQVNRDGEQFFNQGGQVLPEEMYGQDAIRQNMQLRMDRHNQNPDIDYVTPDKPSAARVAADAITGGLSKLGDGIADIGRNTGEYWSEDNAKFEATNPNFGQRVDRSINPLTGFGSSLGAMHDAAGAGDKSDMALAAAQAIPGFAALKTVKALPFKNTFQGNPFNQAATRTAADAARTSGIIGANSVAGASVDEYQAERDGNDNNFADGGMVKSNRGFSPNIGKNGEQFFNQGGQVLDEEEAKRRAARTPGLAPAGIALTPDMANANRVAQQRQGGAQAIEQTKANISGAVGQAATSAYNSAMTIPRTIQNTTFDNRLPGQDFRDAKRAAADSARAKQWASANPDQAKQAGLGMQGVADRATAGLNIPPQPLQGIGGAPMPAPQQASASVPTQQPQVDPMTGQTIAQQPVAEQGVVTQPANDPVQSRHGTDVSNQQPKPDPETGYVTRTDQQRRDFARSNIVDGVPTLNSQMTKTIDPNSINTMGSQAMSRGFNPQTSQALSGALSAAAQRGDWDAVNRHYQSQGQGFAGMAAPGQGQGTRVTVVRDPNRMPTNAEIMQQRMQSAQMRNADAGRRTDIEGQRVAAGIDSDQFRNSILSRQADISGRSQDLAERQAEPTIAQQQRLQALYAEYDAADDAGKARIAQQINQLSGKNEPLKNNFMQLGGGQDMVDGVLRNVPQRLIDLRTGQEIGGGGNRPAQKAPAVGEVRGQYRFKGGNPADQKNWEKI